MGIATLVLRGISGVGKTFLTALLKKAIEKLGKKAEIISKDRYRAYLKEREGYHYTPEEEKRVTEWYRQTYNETTKRKDIDYIICDNTHTREEEILIPCTPKGNVAAIFLINVGTRKSSTPSTIGDNIITRQREEMEETEPLLEKLYMRGDIEWFDFSPRDATEEDADNIIDECELFK